MTVSASTQIPKSSDPAIFQRQCKVLFEYVLRDPSVQEFGSSGQAQQGIDLLARRKSVALDHWIGIQCKLKIKAEKLAKRTVREEAEKALAFEPQLKELIIVTTAPDDAVLHKEAATFTDEQAKLGRDFHVQVWGWGTLETYILQHEDVIRAFSPDAFPHMQRLLKGQQSLREQFSSDTAEIKGILDQVARQMGLAPTRSPTSEQDGSSHGTALDRQIDQYRDIINDGNSAVAMRLLQTLWDDLIDDAPGRIRFRIQANIAACQLRLGEEEEAGRLYLEAYDCAPDEPKAAAFRVLGLIILNRPQEAYDFGISMIGTAAGQAALVGHTLMAARYLPEMKDAFAIIPPEVQDDAFVAVGKVDYLRTHEPDAWQELAVKAHADHPEDTNLARFAAEAAIDRGCRWSDENRRSMLPAEQQRDVRAAIETLSAQLNQMLARPDAATAFDEALCSNLATAYRLLRDFRAAKETLLKGLAIASEDKGLLQNQAMIALEAGTPDEAAEMLDRLPDSRDKIFGQLQVFANQGAWRDIVALAGRSDITGYSDADQAFFESIVLFARVRLGECSDTRQDVADLLGKYVAEAIVPTVLYEIAAAMNDPGWSAELYRAARGRAMVLSLPERLMLARVAEREDDPAAVIELLYGQIPTDHDNDDLRLLARAFVNAPTRQDAIIFSAGLPDHLKKDAFFARVVGSIDYNRGALPGAEAAFRTAIEADRTDLAAHFGLIQTLLRMDRRDEVESHLGHLDLVSLEGPAAQKVGLGQLLVQFGRPQDGLDYGYQVALRNRDDGRACLLYLGLILPEPTDLRIPAVGEHISTDCTVEIERSDGKRLRVTIEAGSDRADIDHYSPAHPFARMLIEAKQGDTVIYDAGGGTPQRWRVLGFKHKYLALLHDIMETFPARFPNIGGFYLFEMQQGDVTPILEQVKARADADAGLFARYADDAFPLSIIAALLGRTTLEVPGQIAARGAVVRTCVGTAVERDAALAAITGAREKGIVLDAYTAWCVYSADHFAALKAVFRRMVLPQSALDELQAWRRQFEHQGGGPLMTIGYAEGQYFSQELSAEQLRQSAEKIDKGIGALRRECEVLPAAAPAPPSELERLITEVSRAGSLDPIYLAVSEDLLLLSEDMHYRNLAWQLHQRHGVWLQTVLMAAVEHNAIDGAAYARSVVDLAARKHDYVTVNAPILVAIAEQEDDDKMPRLQAALTFVGTSNCDVSSHLQVGWDFLLHIWRADGLSDLKKGRACGMMLERLMQMWAKHGDAAEFLRRMIDLSGHRPQLQTYLNGWALGHFIALDRPAIANSPAAKTSRKPKKHRRSGSR